jgi:hypothetical protein
VNEFDRKISRCDIKKCRGMCCYGGVAVDASTANQIQSLATDRKKDFKNLGLDLPDHVIITTEWRGKTINNTAVRPHNFRETLPDYPKHFENTACVFLMNDARCGLQVLSEIDGHHPWHYKPFNCWLHPIKVQDGNIRLYDKLTDPFIYENYPGYVSKTFCGRTDENGQPASEVLKEEITCYELKVMVAP